jgi:hypothetical protein
MNPILGLKLLGSLNALPRTRNLDQNPVLADAQVLVELNDVEGLGDGGLGVKGVTGVDFGRDAAGDDFQDFLAEFDEEAVEGGLDLVVDIVAFLEAVLDCCVDLFCVGGFLGCGEEQRGITNKESENVFGRVFGGTAGWELRCCVLGLVLGDCLKVSRV